MIIGAIFPVKKEFLNRIFSNSKSVFVKFSKLKKIEKGHKILFYAPHDIKALVGEATAKSIDFLSADETRKKFSQNLFLNNFEFNNYITKRWSKISQNRKLLVIELENIIEYQKPISFPRRVTVAGYYITDELYDKLKIKEK